MAERENIKVLIITYYWPPSGGAGVQRWLKFVKYLPQLGIEPIVYTHSNGEVPSVDFSLEKEIPKNIQVIKTEIWEPYGIYKRMTGKKNERVNAGFLSEKKDKSSALKNFSIWVRGNFFIPDARKFWIKPSIKYLSQFLKENKVDLIVSTGPPHSMHMIALGLKNKFNIPWIADFRDPWTNIDFYQDLKLSKRADKKHRKLEKDVLTKADLSIAVGPTLAHELKELGAKECIAITNGYDVDDVIEESAALDAKISIAHIGSFTKSRNPKVLLDALLKLKQEVPNLSDLLELKLVGKVDYSVSIMLEEMGLDNLVRKIDYLPHNEVLIEQKKSHALLLIVNDTPNAKGILTGKVFEYLAAKRPILALAPVGGDLANLIETTKSGVVISENEIDKMYEFLKNLINNQLPQFDFIDLEKYSRLELTKQLASVIERLVFKH